MKRRYEDTWRWKPLMFLVLQILEERGGRISDNELLLEIKRRGEDISRSELNKILMTLEVYGLIYVESVSLKEKIIERIEEERRYLSVGED